MSKKLSKFDLAVKRAHKMEKRYPDDNKIIMITSKPPQYKFLLKTYKDMIIKL